MYVVSSLYFFSLGCYVNFFQSRSVFHGEVRCMLCDPWSSNPTGAWGNVRHGERAGDKWLINPYGVDAICCSWCFSRGRVLHNAELCHVVRNCDRRSLVSTIPLPKCLANGCRFYMPYTGRDDCYDQDGRFALLDPGHSPHNICIVHGFTLCSRHSCWHEAYNCYLYPIHVDAWPLVKPAVSSLSFVS